MSSKLLLFRTVNQQADVATSSNTFTNDPQPHVVGGFFTVAQEVIITSIGTARSLSDHTGPAFTYNAVVSSAISAGQKDIFVFNTIFGTLYLGNYIESLYDPTWPDLTTRIDAGDYIANITGTTVTPSTVAAAFPGGSQEYMRLEGISKVPYYLWQMTPTPSLLTSIDVVPGSNWASTKVTLQPGITYALVSVVGAGKLNYAASRDISTDSGAYIKFGDGFDVALSSPTTTVTATTKGTGTTSSKHITLDAIYNIPEGAMVYSLGNVPTSGTLVTHVDNSGATTVVYTNQFALKNYTSQTVKFWTFDDIATSVDATYINGLSTSPTTWSGDFWLLATAPIQEEIDIPPAPVIATGVQSFTITLPRELLPSNLMEYDLQYAKATDNYKFGVWLDIGTFPAVVTTDATDTDTSNVTGVYTHTAPDPVSPPIYYIYRYRLRTSNDSESEWSYRGYAGQVLDTVASS